MPAVSEKQRRAMWAAAEGNSNLGIPQSVGREFVKNDANQVKPETGDLNEYETAEAIRDGELPSPTKFADCWLFDVRITGTGMAFRDSWNEWAFRDPEQWTSDKFLKRCSSLSVVFMHPDGDGLDSKEYRKRSIGNVFLPYVKKDPDRGIEVWGIARIFDAKAAEAMQKTHCSTSPGVTPPKGAEPVVLESGAKVLDEGLPGDLNHLAICEQGVWDKDGPPAGIRLDSIVIGKGEVVTEEEKAALEKERDDAKARADASEAELKKEREDRAKKDSEREEEEKKREDTRKKDADEKEREDKARRDAAEKMDAKRKDSRKKHHDSKKHDGDFMDCTRCDSEKEEIEKMDRKDAATEEDVDADRQTKIADSRHDATIADLQGQIARLTAANQPLSNGDRTMIAKTANRADALFQMLGTRAPEHMAGEKPMAFRARIMDALSKLLPETSKYKNFAFNDSATADETLFGLVENAVYEEAMNEAKSPTRKDSIGRLQEVVTDHLGHKRTEFFGDSSIWLSPFSQRRGYKVKRFNTKSAAAQ